MNITIIYLKYIHYSEIAANNKDGWIEQSIDKEDIKTESKKIKTSISI